MVRGKIAAEPGVRAWEGIYILLDLQMRIYTDKTPYLPQSDIEITSSSRSRTNNIIKQKNHAATLQSVAAQHDDGVGCGTVGDDQWCCCPT